MMLNNKTLLSLPLDETAYEQKRGGIEFDPFLRVQMSSFCSLSFERISAHEGGESMSFAECALAMQPFFIVVGKSFFLWQPATYLCTHACNFLRCE